MKKIIIDVRWNKKEIKCCDYSEQLVEWRVGWLVVVDQGKEEEEKSKGNRIKQAEVVSSERKKNLYKQPGHRQII